MPRIPETTAELEALGWAQLKAPALAYPEAECLPEDKPKPSLYERWVGLTQAPTVAPSAQRSTRLMRSRHDTRSRSNVSLNSSRDLTSI